MDDRRLDEALTSLRAHALTAGAEPSLPRVDCLGFARAREVVLDPTRLTSQEKAHLKECRLCCTLVTSLERNLPHLTFWSLLKQALGQLSPSERHSVEYHLEAGGCRSCRARQERLRQSLLPVLQMPSPPTPVPPHVVRAAVKGPEVLASAVSGELEAELIRYRGDLSLELRTRSAPAETSLAAYAFQDERGGSLLDGYAVLRPDVEGWYAAEVDLDAARYHEKVGDRCRVLWVGLVDPAVLSEEEWARVSEATPGPEAESEARGAWLNWCTHTLLAGKDLPAPAQAVLQELTDRLH